MTRVRGRLSAPSLIISPPIQLVGLTDHNAIATMPLRSNNFLKANHKNCVSALCHDPRRLLYERSSSFVHHKVNGSYMCAYFKNGFGSNFSRTVQARITQFRSFIRDNQPHKHAGYYVVSCFRSAAECNWILHKMAYNGSSWHRVE